MANKDAQVFCVPVDTSYYTDYLEKVEIPMDFATIKSQLETNWYKCLEEFIEDVNLVFKNCFTYNNEENWVHKRGLLMQEEFKRLG